MEPIRIAYQSYTDESQAGTYWKHLNSHFEDIVDDGTTVDIKGITPPDSFAHAKSQMRCAREMITNAVIAEREGYDAFAIGHFQDAGLYEAVKAVGEELCPELGLTIPVGKDSMSMKTAWNENGEDKSVTSPLSLVISAFGAVKDIRKTVTPQLRTDKGASRLLLLDLGEGKNRLGASCLAQVYTQLGDSPADVCLLYTSPSPRDRG